MALQKLLANLEQGTTAGVVDSYPNHAQFNNGNGLGWVSGNSTSIFDTSIFRQRSYRFGMYNFYDRPGKGFSREPFIGKNKDVPDLDKKPSSLLGFIDSFSDGFVRGGISTAISRSVKDVARLGKFFLSERGLGFLINQFALQQMQPDVPGGNPFFGVKLRNRNREFNPLGLEMLKQVGVNFTGIHFNRTGGGNWKSQHTYSKIVLKNGDEIGNVSNNKIPVGSNRLLTLYDSHIIGEGSDTFELKKTKVGEFFGKLGDAYKTITGKEDNPSILYEYNKGPGSLYGIGKTTLNKYRGSVNGDDKNITYARDIDGEKAEYPLTIEANGYNPLPIGSTNNIRVEGSFVNDRLEALYDEEEIYKGYRETRVGLGTPGDVDIILDSAEQNTYSIFSDKTQDKVNRLDVYQANLAKANADSKDFIKFYCYLSKLLITILYRFPIKSKNQINFNKFIIIFLFYD